MCRVDRINTWPNYFDKCKNASAKKKARKTTANTLTKDEVVWSENLSKRSRPDRVHGTGLQIDQHGPGHVLASSSLVVVNVDTLQLKV